MKGQSTSTSESDTSGRTDAAAEELEYTCAADVVEEDVEWLWLNTFPKAKLSVLAGMLGAGKSFFTMMMAARVSSGTPFLNSTRPVERGQVLILQYEDGLKDTVIKRLRWEGADMSMIGFITGTKGRDGKSRGVDLSADVEKLRLKIRELGNVKLIIVDPLSSYVGLHKKMDSYKDTDVREALRPLTDLIEQEKVAVIGIMHLNKSQMSDPRHRVVGSAAWMQVPRVAWWISEDKNDKDLHWFLAVKNNTIPLAERKQAEFGFRFEENHIVVAQNEEPPSIEDVTRPEPPEDAKDRRSKVETAVDFFEACRASGEKELPAKDVMEAHHGISKDIWAKARKKLGGISTEQRPDGWWWIFN